MSMSLSLHNWQPVSMGSKTCTCCVSRYLVYAVEDLDHEFGACALSTALRVENWLGLYYDNANAVVPG